MDIMKKVILGLFIIVININYSYAQFKFYESATNANVPIQYLEQNNNNQSATSVSILLNPNVVIPVKHNSSPLIWEVSRSTALQYLNKNMFAKNASIDMDYIPYGTNVNSGIALFLDDVWGRIIFVKIESNEIKFYGDNLSDYKFSSPTAFTTDKNGYIYVTDSGNKNVVKLKHNQSTNTLTFISSYSISGLENPTDIHFSTDNTNPNLQYLWIADRISNNILLTDLQCTVLKTFAGYMDNNYQTYNFKSISRIGVDRNDYKNIVILDNNLKQILFCQISTSSNTYFKAPIINQFTSDSFFSDAAVNCFGNILVTDLTLNLIHKFSSRGYICSFNSCNNFSGFINPVRVSNVAFNSSSGVIADYYIANLWDDQTGIRRFLPGSDAFDLQCIKSTGNYNFSFTLSDYSSLRIEVYNGTNLRKTVIFNGKSAGKWGYDFSESEIGLGVIKFKVLYKPWYDDNYGEYQQGWKSKEIIYSVAFSASITGPSSLSPGQQGTWNTSVVGGQSPFHYQWWYMIPQPSLSSIPNSTIQTKDHSLYKAINVPYDTWFTLGTDSPSLTTSNSLSFKLKCNVVDSYNQTVTTNDFAVNVGALLPSIQDSKPTILNQNYPNPFNPTTQISYNLEEAGFVNLKVYNVIGEEIALLANEVKEPGEYKQLFDASKLPSGIYFYKLSTPRLTLSKKMLLVK